MQGHDAENHVHTEAFTQRAVESLIEQLTALNANVGRRLALALTQIHEAASVEEYQQIAIIVRDAWIEFGQSVFLFDVMGADAGVGRTDAKRLVECALRYYVKDPKYLVKLSKLSFDLSNHVQHHANATKEDAWQVLSCASLCMVLIDAAIYRSHLYAKRPYYRCPNCGSLRLRLEVEGMQDVDGPVPIQVLRCVDCHWYYVDELGGISGIGERHL